MTTKFFGIPEVSGRPAVLDPASNTSTSSRAPPGSSEPSYDGKSPASPPPKVATPDFGPQKFLDRFERRISNFELPTASRVNRSPSLRTLIEPRSPETPTTLAAAKNIQRRRNTEIRTAEEYQKRLLERTRSPRSPRGGGSPNSPSSSSALGSRSFSVTSLTSAGGVPSPTGSNSPGPLRLAERVQSPGSMRSRVDSPSRPEPRYLFPRMERSMSKISFAPLHVPL